MKKLQRGYGFIPSDVDSLRWLQFRSKAFPLRGLPATLAKKFVRTKCGSGRHLENLGTSFPSRAGHRLWKLHGGVHVILHLLEQLFVMLPMAKMAPVSSLELPKKAKIFRLSLILG